MTTRKSNVKIENGKVVLSCIVLSMIYDWITKENEKYIKNYIEILLDPSNIIAEKYETHHIIPCLLFKNKIHKNREETELLADKIEGNLIKLSYKNHIMAHYFLWKIFPNNEDMRRPIYLMLGEIDIDTLTENEIREFARIQEECKEANMTEEEKKKYHKLWYKLNKDDLLEKQKNYRVLKHDDISKRNKIYSEKHKIEIAEYGKQWYEKNKESRNKHCREYSSQKCIDPKLGDVCTYNALVKRRLKNEKLYEGVNPKDCIIQNLPSKTTDHEITIFNL